jgi:hypothetical protein
MVTSYKLRISFGLDLLSSQSLSVVYWLSCFSLDSSFAGSNPADSDGFSRAIKILSRTSFGWKVKPSAPRRKTLRNVKYLLRYDKY